MLPVRVETLEREDERPFLAVSCCYIRTPKHAVGGYQYGNLVQWTKEILLWFVVLVGVPPQDERRFRSFFVVRLYFCPPAS